ncbi:MAG: non-ribosomal peptide synthase/polyketide synthase, partial [Longimicrobiaceae bacterium]
GDRLRWRADGRLEFVGRVDEQVKVRGFRIEPGEIEAVLCAHAEVREARVIVREDVPGEQRLVAYIVGGADAEALRDHLRRSLPEYMVPGGFVAMESLPLTPNGKLDVRALPAPEYGAGEEHCVAPRTPTEEVLAGIWADVLGVDRVGVEEGFFDLGGHSLLATQVVSRARQAFGVEVPLRALFEAPTVAELAGRIEALRGTGAPPAPPIERVSREAALPLSVAQQRLGVVDRLEPGSAADNMPAALRLRGSLDSAALRASLDALVARHETLRTTFAEEGGVPVQVIHPAAPVALRELDLRRLPQVEREAEAERLASGEALLPFDLAHGPLLRSTLLRLADDEHVLLFTLHHVVGDGWSRDVLVREVSALYTAFSRGEEPQLAELPAQYADYAVWQRAWLSGEVLEGQIGYWKEALAGAPALLEILTDRPRAAAQGPRAGSHHFTLSAEVTQGLRALSRREGATLFMTTLAAWQALLGRWAGQDDVVVGSPIAGRTRHETEGLIGFFVNMLALRGDLAGDPTWTELLGRIRDTALGAYEHQELPFERLVEALDVERSLTHAPVFQVTFELDRPAANDVLALGELGIELFAAGAAAAKFDLDLSMEDEGEGLRGTLLFRESLFDAQTAARMAGHLEVLLGDMAADSTRRLSEVPLLRGAERAQVLRSWNATRADFPGTCVHELVSARAARTPEATAVVFEGGSLTYAELDAGADRLAHLLMRRGVGPEVRVGISVEKGPEMALAVLAVLKAGGAYVPLDPAYPAGRIAYMLRDSEAALLLTQAHLAARFAENGVPVLAIDALRAELAAGPAGAPRSGVTAENLAYVIYTSGSTGTPKGVAVPHRGVVNLATDMAVRLGLRGDDRLLQFASLSFDVSVEEIFTAWSTGAAVVLSGAELFAPGALLELVEREGITSFELPSAFWHEWVREFVERGHRMPASVRFVRVGGERVSPERLREWAELRVPLVHVYGVTEASCTSAALWLEAGEDAGERGSLPIGRPTGNVRLYVLDAAGEPLPAGVPGEMYIGGAGLARGYLGRAELTAERFVPDPFGEEAGGRLYRSGDRVRWLGEGTMEFLGRMDAQVKLRGFRIEPGEIEAVLLSHPQVREAAVVVRAEVQRLVAYVVAEEGAEVTAGELRGYVAGRVPQHMVPGAFVALEQMPLNVSGKVDRRALPAPAWGAEGAYVAPRTAAEEMLAGIWAEVLGVDRVGVEEGFFELGGHSLLATQVVSRARQAFGVEVPLRALFEAPTVAGLAGRIEALRGTGALPAPPIERLCDAREGPLPLSFAQQRLWVVDRLEPGSPAYNMPAALRLRGALDAAALRASLDALVARHETLRTTFAEEGGVPVQLIHPAAPVALRELDLRGLPQVEREAEAGRLASDEALTPFDLARGPLLRSTLLRLADDEHVLLFTLHHVVSDGWSMQVLTREVSALYTAFSRGEEPRLAELPVQYADYAVWQRAWLSGDVLEAQIGFWREKLRGAPPLLEISTDHPRGRGQSPLAQSRRFTLPRGVAEGLRALSRREGTTLFMTTLAAWQVLLGRYAAQEDVVVGTPTAGRTRHETEGLIGFFVNMLALRTDFGGDPTWSELLGRVRETALGAYAHQDLPFERLVEELDVQRSLAHAPVFQTVFALDRAGGDERPSLGELQVEPVESGAGAAKFDLSLTLTEEGEGLEGTLVYREALFEAETVARMAGHLEVLLESMAAGRRRSISEVSLLRASERAQLLAGSAAKPLGLPSACLHEMISAQAERTPGAPAVSFGGEALGYAALESAANRLAHHLRRRGVRPETRVGICLERSPEMVVGVLAVLKAGGAYVPLDPDYPAERLAYTLADSGAALLLTRTRLLHALPGFQGEVVCLDAHREAIAAEPDEAPPGGADVQSAAYVIYTSGSTGRPKGVVVEHATLADTLRGAREIFGFAAGEVMPALASYAFDIWGFEVFAPLLAGGQVRLLERGTVRDVDALVEELATVDGVHAVPALMREVVARVQAGPGTLPGIRRVFVGGDAVPPDLLEQMRRVFPAARLWVLYGPTENTILGSATPLQPGTSYDWQMVGRPLPGVGMHVLDPAGSLLPAGVPGELCLAGAGVARGYLGRADATAAVFVPDPFSGVSGARLYRTGDRVRRRADGELEFLGRVDAQVKIRGFRIEPGEIEAVLLEDAGVREALVMVREDPAFGMPGRTRLVAYVAAEPDAGVSAAGLRALAGARLPEHMVPGAFVVLERLPLGVNGKVDRGALPAPEQGAGSGYLAPRTVAEEVLAGIWAEVLGVERVGVESSFFDLGGHSLLATQVVSRVRRAFGVDVPLRALFEAPTVAGLAGRVEALRDTRASTAPPVERVSREGPLPLSFAQQRLWVVDRLEPGSPAYNMPYALRLTGALDTAALRASMDALVQRHETLRTTFAEQGGVPVQVIHPAVPVELLRLDLRSLPAGARAREVERLASEEALRPFDLARGPLLRSTLLRVDEAEHVLLFTLHHVVSDAWSMQLLVREVSGLYGAFSRGEEPRLAELPVQYADFAVWQRAWLGGDVLEEQIGFWREKLRGAPPLLEIPTDHPRGPGQSPRAQSHRFALPRGVSEGLRALSRREGATLFMTVLAGWQALLGRYAGQEDVVVGSPISGRSRHEVEGLIGFFVNMLALRADLGGDPTWTELLGRTRATALGAFEHQELPFERLVEELGAERSLTHTPVFQVTFALQKSSEEGRPSLGGLELEPFESGAGAAKFDLELAVADQAETLEVVLAYREALFDAATAARIAGHLETLLEAMAAEPRRRLSEVSLLRGAERVQVLETWNAAAPELPQACVHELFAEQAARTPGAVAIVFGEATLTYAELDRAANQLAHVLRQHGVRPDTRVGVCLERSLEMVVSLLAVLKAGGAYAMLDPQLPPARLALLLGDLAAPVVLSRAALRDRLPGVLDVLCVDAERERIAREPDTAPAVEVTPEHLCYVIYTSGSTGLPKGTEVPHRAIPGFFRDAEYVRFDAEQVLLQHSSTSWDALTLELWPALLTGGRCVLYTGQSLDPEQLAREVERHGVTTLWLTAALFNLIVDTRPELLDGVRQVMTGGEAVSGPHLRRAWERGPELRLVNGYGPSECTVFTSCHVVGEEVARGDVPPIGRPVGDRRVYVLDGWGEPVPVGVPGELHVGGAAVARGYLGQAELTATRFVPDALGSVPGARLYASGDRVRWLASGELEFLGRVDAQVKIRGFRIEPGEVEAVLAGVPAVRESAVVVREDTPGQKRLVAYFVPREGIEVSTGELRAQLSARLPEYLVPSAFVELESLPLTPNGKLDRRALPAPDFGSSENRYVAPRTPTEEVLAGIWSEVLGVERVGVEGGFFELGGHSLLATQVVSRARQAFGVEVPLRALFEAPTVAGLAARIEELRSAGTLPAPPIERVSRGEALPLSFAQQRLWVVDRLEPGGPAYNLAYALRLSGKLDPAALRASLDALVRRHETLRTTFAERDGVPVQVVHPAASAALRELDLRGLPGAEREPEAERLAAEEALEPFDLARGPLLRSTLLRLADQDHVLLFTLHHVVTDGWSMDVLVREISALYAAFSRGEEPRLPELPVQYADFAVWQRAWLSGETLEEQIGYWKDALAGAPPLLGIAVDRPRSAAQGTRAGMHRFVLPATTAAGLRALSRREGATLFMTLLAAWQTLLGRYAGQEDVVVGTPIAGRTRVELEGLIGFFVNMLPLRGDLAGDPTWAALLGRVQETALDAYAHQHLPFERLVDELAVERSLTHTPVFQAIFALTRAGAEDERLSLGDVRLEPFGGEVEETKFDLNLRMLDAGEELSGALLYRTALFEAETAARMGGHLEVLLEAMAAAKAEQRLSEVPLLRGAEREQLLHAWNGADTGYTGEPCLHELVHAQVLRTPGAPALRFEGQRITYADLYARACRLASLLRREGVGPEVRVAICMDPAPEMIVTVLGVMLAGGAYLPLDPELPAERRAYMLRDAAPVLLLTQKALADRLADCGLPLFLVDAEAERLARESDEAPHTGVVSDNLAYVI